MYYITTPTTLCVPYQNMTHRTQINLLFTLKCYNIHVHVYFFILLQNTMWLNTKDSFIATTFFLYIHQIYRSIWHRIWQVRRPPFSSVQVSPKYSNNASLSALRIPCIFNNKLNIHKNNNEKSGNKLSSSGMVREGP